MASRIAENQSLAPDSISRRFFLKGAFAGLGGLSLPWPSLAMARESSGDPHFFLMVLLEGGTDISYLFDARSRTMTAAGLIQNYADEDSQLWVGKNGNSCLAAPSTKPLEKFKSDLAIVNGIMMSTSFDGHEQNTNFMFTGNAFGGASFVPHLNAGKTIAPIDTLIDQVFGLDVSNGSASVTINGRDAKGLSQKITVPSPNTLMEKSRQFLAQRNRELAVADLGMVSRGAEQLTSSMDQYGNLARKVKDARIEDDILNEASSSLAQLKLSLEYFRKGITRSSIISYDGNFDNHSPADAKEQPKEFTQLSTNIAAILQTLKDTPYDDKRSFFDLTTVMVASEFSRTMRQQQLPIDATGTDHNPLNNSFIFAGKGIQGDIVIGSSDFTSETEILSVAHLTLDPDRLKCMGRPFDFATGLSKPVVPNSYNIHDYLNVPSVINTVYSLFSRSTGIDLLAANALKIDRNTVVAPVVEQLLKI